MVKLDCPEINLGCPDSEVLVDIYKFLEKHRISYKKVEHPAVYTCEQARELVPEIEGCDTKNLFLRDKKAKNHFLLIVTEDKRVDLNSLSKHLEVSKLSFASPERLKRYLGIEPGAVSILAIINDQEQAVQVLFDADIEKEEYVKCHPLVNTATLSVKRTDIEKILDATKHGYKFVNIPS